MNTLIIIFSLSIFGIILSLYLIAKRRQHAIPYCMDGAQCQIVLESKYNHIFGVHNDIMGLLGNLGIAVVTLLLILGIGPTALLRDVLIGSIAFGAVVSFVLVYIQKYILKAWCFICVVSAINMGIMTIIILLDFL